MEPTVTNLSTDSLFESYLRMLHKARTPTPQLFVYGYLHALGDNELLTGRLLRFRLEFNRKAPKSSSGILNIWYSLVSN